MKRKGDIREWRCGSCGFPYNSLKEKECGECGRRRRKNARITTSIVIGTATASNVSFS